MANAISTSKEACLWDCAAPGQPEQNATERQEGWLTVHTKRKKALGISSSSGVPHASNGNSSSNSSSRATPPPSPRTPGLLAHTVAQPSLRAAAPHAATTPQHVVSAPSHCQHSSADTHQQAGSTTRTAGSTVWSRTYAPRPVNSCFHTPAKAWAVPGGSACGSSWANKESNDSRTSTSNHGLTTDKSWPKLCGTQPDVDQLGDSSDELLPCAVTLDDTSEGSTVPVPRMLSCGSSTASPCVDDSNSSSITSSNGCPVTCCGTRASSCAGDEGHSTAAAEVDVLLTALNQKLLLHQACGSVITSSAGPSRPTTPPEPTTEMVVATSSGVARQSSLKVRRPASDKWPAAAEDALAAAAFTAAATAAAAAAAAAATRSTQPKQGPLPPAPPPPPPARPLQQAARHQSSTPRHSHTHAHAHPAGPPPPAPPPPPPLVRHHEPHEAMATTWPGTIAGAMQDSQLSNPLPEGQVWGYPAPMYVRIGPDGPHVVSALDMPQFAAHHASHTHCSSSTAAHHASPASPASTPGATTAHQASSTQSIIMTAAAHPHVSAAAHPRSAARVQRQWGNKSSHMGNRSSQHAQGRWLAQAHIPPHAPTWHGGIMCMAPPPMAMHCPQPYAMMAPPMACVMYAGPHTP